MVLILALLLVLILFGAGFAVHLAVDSGSSAFLFCGSSDSPLVGVRARAVTASIGGNTIYISGEASTQKRPPARGPFRGVPIPAPVGEQRHGPKGR